MSVSLEEIYCTKYHLVKLWARRKGHSVEDAEDIAQNVFLRLTNGGLARYDESRPLIKWLYVVSANEISDAKEKKRRDALGHTIEPPTPRDHSEMQYSLLDIIVKDESPSFEREGDGLDRRQQQILRERILRLPPSLRYVIAKSVYEKKLPGEIADYLGYTAHSIRTLTTSARRMLGADREGTE